MISQRRVNTLIGILLISFGIILLRMDIDNSELYSRVEYLSHITYSLNQKLDLGVLDSCGIVKSIRRTGSYIVIRPNIIMTAGHCIDADTIWIVDNKGIRHEVTSVWKSKEYDIAFLVVDANLPVLPLGDMPSLLDDIYVVGSPLTDVYGHEMKWINNITKGIVSKLNVDWVMWKDGIIVDAAAYPGNSGGPLLSSKSEIIGIMVGSHNRQSEGGDNLWLAEPVSHIKEALREFDNDRLKGDKNTGPGDGN